MRVMYMVNDLKSEHLPPTLSSTTIGHLRNRSTSGLLCVIVVNSDGETECISCFTGISPQGENGLKVREQGSTWSFVRSFGLFSARRGDHFLTMLPRISNHRVP